MKIARLDYGLKIPAGLLASNALGGEEIMCRPSGGHGVAFRITARLRDGLELWRGFFYSRREALVFWRGAQEGVPFFDLPQPIPAWPYGLQEVDGLVLEFATVTFLTSPTGSNQTYSVPSDWNSSNNSVETIGGGGGGHRNKGGGGGGGGYSKQTNISLTPGGSATYRIGALGAEGSTPTAGGDSWFNAATLAASTVGSQGGGAGKATSSGSASGGQATSGIGATKYNGGNGGAQNNAQDSGAGGGGAAGPNGAGNAGSANTSPSVSGAGGSGDAGVGGAGGAATSVGTQQGNPGGAGTEWDGSHGSGGGGSGSGGPCNTTPTGGAGGSYGGGGGGDGVYTVLTGSGGQGIVVVTYTPVASISLFRPLPL